MYIPINLINDVKAVHVLSLVFCILYIHVLTMPYLITVKINFLRSRNLFSLHSSLYVILLQIFQKRSVITRLRLYLELQFVVRSDLTVSVISMILVRVHISCTKLSEY